MSTDALTHISKKEPETTFLGEASSLLNNRATLKNVIDATATGLELATYVGPHFNMTPDTEKFCGRLSGKFNAMQQGLAIPGLFVSLNEFRHTWNEKTDDAERGQRLFNTSLEIVNAGSESVLFANSINLVDMKDGLQTAKGLFWGSTLLLEGFDFFKQVGEAKKYQEKANNAVDTDVKSYYNHKLVSASLKVLQRVTGVALAAIALVALLFASLAQGFIFNPVVSLSLAMTWLVLSISLYLYDRAIERMRLSLPLGKLPLEKV